MILARCARNYTLAAKDPKQQGLRGSLGAYRLGFRHKIVTHDLLSYAMQHSTEHLSTITTEELRHNGLMPTAAADHIAQTFFDFVVKHNLTDTMVSMNVSENLDVHVSDNLDVHVSESLNAHASENLNAHASENLNAHVN